MYTCSEDYITQSELHVQRAPTMCTRPPCQSAQKGYGVVHTGGAEFEARKRGKVDLISFGMVIKLKNCQILMYRGTQ